MSQQGIFSIATDAQAATSSPANGGQNGSPFSVVDDEAAENSADDGEGSREGSPFQSNQNQQRQFADTGRGAIPERRPEGQSSSFGSAAIEPEATAQGNVFEAVEDNAPRVTETAGAFQMNGFSQHSSDQMMEAAPVAAAQAASPFVEDRDYKHDYEAAKANLEPQQDFAAVPSRFEPVQESRTSPAPVQQPTHVPQMQPQMQPQIQPQQVKAPEQKSAASSTGASVASGIQQLELRAIFGVDHVLDLREILQRARTLPGIRNVAIVGEKEAAALSNFRMAIQGMGLGNSDEMKLSSGGGTVDFISEDNTTLAILLEGSYAPGVQETLIIVAREIGKLA